MEKNMAKSDFKKGGSFLISESDHDVFTPEDFTDDHKMIKDAIEKFVKAEILPVNDRIETDGVKLSRGLIQKAGEMGMLGIEIDEEFGGMELDAVSSTIMGETMGHLASIAIAIGAHSSIGTLPLYYFGTKNLKGKYLAKLVSGELIGAYCLTEPDAGSDALSVKTKAVLSEDKSHYIINGTKQFITNGGIADLFTVFVKIDGEHFTVFMIERGFGGVSTGEEENKLGIKGSSTTQVIFDNVKVPVENLLGEIGKGHKIAFNILNSGRLKLGAMSVGCCKHVINYALKYTTERKQFGKSLNQLGLIQEKLAKMFVRTWVGESSVYRATGLVEQLKAGIDRASDGYHDKILKSIEEYSIESSIIKIFSTEAMDYVVDEGLQCLGGYGFIAEYPMEQFYRDARISRIYEGTNEINRLLITGMLLRKGMKGDLPLMEAAQKVQQEITDFPALEESSGELLEEEQKFLKSAKKAVLLIAGAISMKFGDGLKDEQELMALIADSLIEIFVLESALIRALKIYEKDRDKNAEIFSDVVKAYAVEAFFKLDSVLKESIASSHSGDEASVLYRALKRYMKYTLPNVKKLRRNIVEKLISGELVL